MVAEKIRAGARGRCCEGTAELLGCRSWSEIDGDGGERSAMDDGCRIGCPDLGEFVIDFAIAGLGIGSDCE